MATTSSAIFNGTSRFSSDFQQVITRAISIASLPMQQVQNEVGTLQSRSTELSALNTKFGALNSALQSFDSALATGSLTSTLSEPTVASASLSGAPYAGTYGIEVVDTGAHATSLSSDNLTTVSDPNAGSFSDATRYTLSVGSQNITITPGAKTLIALADAINLSGGGVSATVVNIGSAASPDNRLSLEGTKLGDLPIGLTAIDGSQPGQVLLTAGPAGAPATYRVNGRPSNPIPTDTPTVTISPGISVTLLAQGTTQLTVSRNASAIGTALSALVIAYNAAQAEVATNRGQGKGALQGQSILNTVSSNLSSLLQFSTGNSGISSLTSLGITSDKSGVLSFDATAFSNAAAGNFDQLTKFLGSSTTGGFLKTAADAIQSLTDSSSGLISGEITSTQSQISKDNETISTQQSRVDLLQANLQKQMSAADAAIATMEQQYQYFSNMFTAMTQSKNGQ